MPPSGSNQTAIRLASSCRYIVVGSRPWNRRVFQERLAQLTGKWRFIGKREKLTAATLRAFRPRYVFFLHWSWMVPADIVDEWECVCFHMTDVPYGRGGSPLQNLILRGHRRTKLTALRMTEQLDAGPVYMKRALLLTGSAGAILERATELAAAMIAEIIHQEKLHCKSSARICAYAFRPYS